MNRKVVQDLQELFNSNSINNLILNKNQKNKYYIIKQTLYFYIITHNYKDFGTYIDAREYLEKEKKYNEEEIEQVYLENFIRNGYLFHVTSSKNEQSILENGLLTPNNRNINNKNANELQEYSEYLNEKYNHYFPKVIPNEYFFDNQQSFRYDSIFFGFDLEYLLKTYGSSSELSRFIKETLEAKFNLNFKGLNKEDITSLLENKLQSDSILQGNEIQKALDLLDPFIEEDNQFKDIILFPYSKLVTTNPTIINLKNNDKMYILERLILNSILGNSLTREFSHNENISPDDLIVINTEDKPVVRTRFLQ